MSKVPPPVLNRVNSGGGGGGISSNSGGSVDDYHVIELVGEGSFGKVYKARRKYGGSITAMKFIAKHGKTVRRKLRREGREEEREEERTREAKTKRRAQPLSVVEPPSNAS